MKDLCCVLSSDYRFVLFVGGTPDREYICAECIINQDYTHFHSTAGHDEHYGFIYHTCERNRFGPIDLRSALDRDSEFRMNFKVRDRNMRERTNIYHVSKGRVWAPKKIERYALFFETAVALGRKKARRKEIKFVDCLKSRNLNLTWAY